MTLNGGRPTDMATTRVFFTTDIHGADEIFFKFLNVRLVHDVDAIILGGDITGKLIIPLVKQADGSYAVEFLGGRWKVKTEAELRELEKAIRRNGFYPYRTDQTEVKELEYNKQKLDELFSQLMIKRLREWINRAEQRLKGTGILCYVSPGNDDRFVIDEVLKGSDYVINPEERVIEIDGTHEMITLGWTNPTPWNTPRECSEEELASKIEAQVCQVKDMNNCIFNLHAPPHDTRIDQAPKLDKTLKPVVIGSHVQMVPVGSLAVRAAIEKHQPLVGLHGHVHESKGTCKIGRTLCLNPGSAYQEGVLLGSIVILGDHTIVDYLHISG